MIALLIYSFATWRIASMFAAEAGPGDMFLIFREKLGVRHDDAKQIMIVPDGFFPGVFSCVWCCSVWVGAFWMLFDLFSPWLAIRLATAFAFSTGAILIQHIIER